MSLNRKIVLTLLFFIVLMWATDRAVAEGAVDPPSDKSSSIQELYNECKSSCRSAFDSHLGACNMQGWDPLGSEYKECVKSADSSYLACLKSCRDIPNKYIEKYQPIEYDLTSGWKVAKDQSGADTKIQYNIITRYVGKEFYAYGLALFNGYDRPVEFDYKVYFAGSRPSVLSQYLYTNKTLDWFGWGDSEPVKVEIVKIFEVKLK